MIELLKLYYKAVFDENDEITLCGREKCKELIAACEELKEFVKDKDFGDIETGMMNIENIKKLMKG